MADPILDGDAGTPRWVKVAAIVAVAVVVLIIVTVATGLHDGPSRHSAPDGGTERSA